MSSETLVSKTTISQPCSDIGRDERVEAKLLDRDTELGKLALVGLDHVGVSLSDLLKLSLDLPNGLVFELLHLLKSAPDHAESLGVNPCGRQDLIGLGVLGLKAFLDGFELLLEDKVAQTSLAMHIVDHVVELLKQLLLLLLNVLVLLETNFILPLGLLEEALLLHDLGLFRSELHPHNIVSLLLFLQTSNLFLDLLEGLDDLLVLGLTDHFLAIGGSLSDFLSFEVSAQSADHVHVQTSDVVVVVVDVLVLLVVLSLELLDCFVFLGLNLGDLSFSLRLHVLSETGHLGLVLLLDLVGDALILLSFLGRQLVVVLV